MMNIKKRASVFRRLLSLLWPSDANRASHGERCLSAVGGFIGMAGLLWISGEVLDLEGAAMVFGSMGATIVLVFAVPHGALSQPWSVFGGHLGSALIGVTCARFIGDPLVAAAVAIACAIAAMYYLHCIHPPGGATALVAVLGGDAVEQLGYGFVLCPVLVNVLLVLTIAVIVNMPFRHRRYPATLCNASDETNPEVSGVTHQDLVYALSRLDSFIDVSERDLQQIFALAQQHAQVQTTGEFIATTVGQTARHEATASCAGG